MLPQTGVDVYFVEAVPSMVRVSRMQTPPSYLASSKKSKFSLRRERKKSIKGQDYGVKDLMCVTGQDVFKFSLKRKEKKKTESNEKV